MTKKLPPILTVGLPFYNNEKTLADAIKSVLMQTYSNFEFLLINDGSTDGSLDIARRFAKIDKRIKLISDPVNRGLVFRLNQIIDEAQGQYLARMDSDDMMLPQKLERQMEILLKNDSIDIIDTSAFIINENGDPIGVRRLIDISNWNRRNVLRRRLFFHPTIIAKTSWHRKNKYDNDFIRSEDFELWCRSFSGMKYHRIYEPLFLYREGKINVKDYVLSSSSHRKAVIKYYRGVLSKKELVSELLESHVKSGLYRIFGLFKMQHFLASKRNVVISADQKREIQKVVSRIKDWDKNVYRAVSPEVFSESYLYPEPVIK